MSLTYIIDLYHWPISLTYITDLYHWPISLTYTTDLYHSPTVYHWSIPLTYITDLQYITDLFHANSIGIMECDWIFHLQIDNNWWWCSPKVHTMLLCTLGPLHSFLVICLCLEVMRWKLNTLRNTNNNNNNYNNNDAMIMVIIMMLMVIIMMLW